MPIPCLTRRSLAAVLAAGIALCGGWSSALQAQNDENPVGFLQDLQDDAIDLLSGPTLSDGDREQEFRHLFNNNFDLPAIGRPAGVHRAGLCPGELPRLAPVERGHEELSSLAAVRDEREGAPVG